MMTIPKREALANNSAHPASCQEAALDYLAHGWSVIPILPRGKRPLVEWKTYQHQRPTEAKVRGWRAQWPDANVAIVTGAISGLIVLDVDPRHGGEVSLKDLECKYGALPKTLQNRTGGGGHHYYFRHPGGPIKNSSGSLGPGLDIKADGGCVTAPPSLHVSGQPYTWEKGCSPEDLPVAPLPAWLLSLLQAPNLHSPQTPTHGDGQPVAEGSGIRP